MTAQMNKKMMMMMMMKNKQEKKNHKENGTVENIKMVLSLAVLHISYYNLFIIIFFFRHGRSLKLYCWIGLFFDTRTHIHYNHTTRSAYIHLSFTIMLPWPKDSRDKGSSNNDRNNVLLLINSISIPNKSRITQKRNWCRFK